MRFTARSVMQALGVATAMAAMATPAMAEQYIVKFKDNASFQSAKAQKALATHAILDAHDKGSLVTIDIANKDVQGVAKDLQQLLANKNIEYVVPNTKIHLFADPNDPSFSRQWSMAKVRAAEAWEYSTGANNVTVAVIDTGIDLSHEDLRANAWVNPGEIAGNGIDDDNNGFVDDINGWDFLDNDADPDDATSSQNPGHGTHCAGIVGAVGNNGTGISGMSQSVSLMALRFIGPNGQGDLMGAIKSIDYAVAQNVDAISASWGAKIQASQAQPLIEAIGRANDAGIPFVAAAANDGANNDSTSMFPANADFPNVISVAASDNSDGKPSWSNYGKAKVDLAAPGADILSTLPGNGYRNLSGTSMATPLVSGLVALMKAGAKSMNDETLTAAQIEAILQTTGSTVAIETACDCRVDAAAAMQRISSRELTVVPAAKTLAPGATYSASAYGGSGEGYTYSVADNSIAEVTSDGQITAVAIGQTTLTVTDSEGNTATSMSLRVADAPGGGGGGEECPLGDPMLCELMCALDPTLPWCN